jgi:hypothetical protein
MRHLVLTLVLLCACCATSSGATSADARVRSSLDLLADIIDPAYALAMQGCRESGEIAMQKGAMGKQSQIETENEINDIFARCHRAHSAFEMIRVYHNQATSRVEAGDIKEAEELVERIRESWRSLREDAP